MMESFDKLLARFEQPMPMRIVLTPRQIYAVGRIIVQWSALHQFIEFKVNMWARHPALPPHERPALDDLRETNRKLSFLADASKSILADKPEFKDEFRTKLARIRSYKNKRDWFAHGTFALNDNTDPERIVVSYKDHKFKIATAKAEAMADEIALLTGWLGNFDWRANKDVHRALHERLAQSLPSHANHPPDPSSSTPPDPPQSSQE
jgi:hypothetical protein